MSASQARASKAAPSEDLRAGFLQLRDEPRIYLTILKGKWLKRRTTVTTSWRLEDAKLGFQRIVNQDRAKAIAKDVLDSHLTFPNSIVIASRAKRFEVEGDKLLLPSSSKFLVVDGQHRLWAEEFSEVDADYPVVLHVGLTEKEMAKLFLDINDNQRRVPSSLRWDLYRLVRPDSKRSHVEASEIAFELMNLEGSALYRSVDRTSEQPKVKLKLGSIAPEIYTLIANKGLPLRALSFDEQVKVFDTYFSAIRDLDTDAWVMETSPFYKARVLRATLRILGDILRHEKKSPTEITVSTYTNYLEMIDATKLNESELRKVQGAAGVKAIYNAMWADVFPS